MGFKKLEDYFDDWGLISQINPNNVRDGGDACNRTSCYNFAIWFQLVFLKESRKGLGLINSSKEYIKRRNKKFFNREVPVRHPDSSMWYSDLDRFSRDQSFAYVISLAIYSPVLFKKFFWLHAKHLFLLTWNTRRNHTIKANHDTLKYEGRPEYGKRNYNWKLPDITGPEFWVLYLRGFGWPKIFMYPFDLFIWLNAISKKAKGQDDDVINFVTKLAYCHAIRPTFFIQWSIKLTDWNDIKSKMKSFFKPEFEPPMYEVYKPILSYLAKV